MVHQLKKPVVGSSREMDQQMAALIHKKKDWQRLGDEGLVVRFLLVAQYCS